MQRNYRPGTSTRRGTVTTFREQMADYAKGQVLRELRKKDGRSRETIAAEIGVTTKTLYSWENDGGIKMENARKLAAIYGIDDPLTLVARDDDAGDQLDRIEGKLDRLLAVFAAATSPGGSDVPDRVADLPDPDLGPPVPSVSRAGGTGRQQRRRSG